MSDNVPVARRTDVDAALDRMAAQILAAGASAAEITAGEPPGASQRSAGRPPAAEPGSRESLALTLVGIRRRGVPLARALHARIEDLGGAGVEIGELELKRYSDDLEVLHHQPHLEEPDRTIPIEGRRVLLVDDVLYTGRTLARAVQHVATAGARDVRCAVLCIRSGAELPIRADFVGFRFDVGAGGIVEVLTPPYEDELGVVLRFERK